jgi:transcriptional regulator
MYLPKHFSEDRPEILKQLIIENPLASLVTVFQGIPELNHIPMILSADGKFLQCHIPKANPLYEQLHQTESQQNQQALISFQGVDAYITPKWYPTKKENGKVVPTWNYAVVHIRGTIVLKDDRAWLCEHLHALTQQMEKTRDSDWQVSDAPQDYLDSMMNVLVGIEISIDSMAGKMKLSQNRLDKDRDAVMENLTQSKNKIDQHMSQFAKELKKNL